MSGSLGNPLVQQGTLNRLLTQITVANTPALNVSASYMSKAFVQSDLGNGYTTQIQTGTGVVNSPEPYVMATFTVNLLRTQALANAWLQQVQSSSVIGTVTGYTDSTAFPSITLQNTSVTSVDAGAWDGTDAVVKIIMTGVFYINNSSWAAA